jgi:methylase of polypeptide subunit release factors
VLDAAGYAEPAVLAALGLSRFPESWAGQRGLLLHRTRGGSPLETLVRLLLLGEAVDEAAFERAVSPSHPGDWAGCGLVALEGGLIRPLVRLRPHGALLLAHDPSRVEGERLRGDFVMGVGSSSITLSRLSVRRPSRRTLDLGTGCGIQALLAAPHSDAVVATDRNPRAVAYAAFNAALNGAAAVECREGDLFAPVEGERFDLIVSNPPFVISPDRSYLFRDAGMEGDAVCRAVVRGGAEQLEPGGFCQLLCSFAVPEGGDWREVIAEWCEGTGCDAWAMCVELHEPATYATTWISHTEPPERFAELFDAWMDHYRRRGIAAMGNGVLSLRRTEGGRAPWFRAEDTVGHAFGDCGEDMLRGFALRDFLERLPDAGRLLDIPLRLAPDVRLEQEYAPGGEGWEVEDTRLRRVQGLAYQGSLDPHGALFLGRCDGTRPLGTLLAETAAELGVELDSLVPGALRVTRTLVEQGFLLPPP